MLIDDIVTVAALSTEQIYLETNDIVKYNIQNNTHISFFQRN